MTLSSNIIVALCLIPAALAVVFTVDVGANSELKYTPSFVNAAPGDSINFIFHPKNHTATVSSFEAPCTPNPANPSYQNSGFQPVASDAETKMVTFAVTGTGPIWFYCQQTGHCAKGMVFAVNPGPEGSANSFSNFQAAAMATGAGTSAVASPASSTNGAPPTDTTTAPYGSSPTGYPPSVPPPTTTTPGGATTPATTTITVGATGLVYNPANITANIGDTIVFEFHPKNHTVTQSSFAAPCTHLESNSAGLPGFKSGFTPVSANATVFPTFSIVINDTKPIWGYCGQPGPPAHCASGMVFSINANESSANTFAAFQAAAKASGNSSSTASASGTAASATATKNFAVVSAGISTGLASMLTLLGLAIIL